MKLGKMNKEKLLKILSKNNIDKDRYSIYDGNKSDCIVLEKWGFLYKLYYVDERGGQSIFDYAKDENEAFEKMLKFFKINITYTPISF